MKRNLLTKMVVIAIFAITGMPAMAQSIVADDLNGETGVRTISTDGIVCRSFKDRVVLTVSLYATIEKNDTSLHLKMKLVGSVPMSVPEMARLLIKLNDDSVIELNAFCRSEGVIGKPEIIGNHVYEDYCVTPSYVIDENTLQNIINIGVKKVRLEMSPDYYEKDFSKDKIGEALGKLYPVLKEAISVPKSFDADF